MFRHTTVCTLGEYCYSQQKLVVTTQPKTNPCMEIRAKSTGRSIIIILFWQPRYNISSDSKLTLFTIHIQLSYKSLCVYIIMLPVKV